MTKTRYINNNDNLYYYVGNKTVKENSVSKAVIVRLLEVFEGNKENRLDVGMSLLMQTQVSFVRIGEDTVYPFSHKYLEECIRINLSNNVNE